MLNVITVPQLYQVSGGENTVYPDEVRSLVCSRLHESVRSVYPHIFPPCVCGEGSPIDYEIAPKKPRLHRQVAAFAYKKYKVKMPQDVLDEIAQAAANVLDRAYFFDVVPHMAWAPGTYGENTNSCWWNSYWRSRCILFPSFNGHAIRAYHRGRDNQVGAPAGRAVLLATEHVIPGSFIMTNVYGITQDDFSTAVKAMMRERYGTVHSRYVGVGTNSESYVNNNKGILYSPNDIPKHIDYVSLEIEQDPPTIPAWCMEHGRMLNVYGEYLTRDREWVWVKTSHENRPQDHTWVRTDWIENGLIRVYNDPRITDKERTKICL